MITEDHERTQSESTVDRRRWLRVPIAVPLLLRGSLGGGKTFSEFATALNISAGGALVVSRRYISPSSHVQLDIPTAPLPEAVLQSAKRRISGRLVRAEPGDEYHLLGIEFDSLLTE